MVHTKGTQKLRELEESLIDVFRADKHGFVVARSVPAQSVYAFEVEYTDCSATSSW